MNEILKTLLDKKAESNNTIDLNAYALGLEDGFNADNWIKVSDRLPESDGDYLVTLKNEAVFILCFSEEFTDNWLFAHDPTWRNNGINPVTHWQPLPNAPKD